ncbi:formyltetrahydrofolate deformylase [Litorivicinus lipolyticus]|uniref:formyltetrahydrofolate deformylase n=1 Tax=Litorivicinus lipolyticus TaxID=418701 RepID=UPI003B59B26E
MSNNKSWVFAAQCDSILGTVDVCTHFMAQNCLYIDEIQSFDDKTDVGFFIRIAFRPEGDDFDAATFGALFQPQADRFNMSWSLTAPDHRERVAIMVSKYDHCLNDLLYRYRTGNMLDIEIPLIISNHPDLQRLAEWHDIPYYHLPISKDTKPAQEAKIRELLEQYDIDLVVLARYMQVMSPAMCEYLDGWAINIHHSLLPGFKGAKPYHQAWAKGAKMVGATAHYINNDLDEGPIITQGIQDVDHTFYPEDLVRVGQDVERVVLAKAVRLHVSKRVFLSGGRTVVLKG